MKTSLRWLGLLAAAAACGGGGDGGTNNNPPPTAVASVEVSPASAALGVPGSIQLTATARDASGVTLGGRTVTWYTTSAAVATVSSSGLVTAVGEGVAVITASVEGKSATATITVSVTQGGAIIAEAQIGPAGGTVGTTDVAVTIPAGALMSTQKVILVKDTVETTGFEENAASLVYRIDGIPAGTTVQARVRVKMTKPLSNQGAIAMGAPVARMSEFTDLEMGYRLFAATDSSGYLVATVPIRGRPASWSSLRSGLVGASAGDPKIPPRDFKAAALLTGLVDVRHTLSAGGHFEGWGFVRGVAPQAEVDRQLAKALPLMEQSYATALQKGYNFNHRTVWPMDVYVMPLSFAGLYYSVAPDPYDPNLGYLALGSKYVDDPVEFAATTLHEFFHFVQTSYTWDWGWARLYPIMWLNEATASWMEQFHPAAPSPWPAGVARMLRDSLWTGVDRDLPPWSGYGKAPMIEYMVSRHGADQVRQMYENIRGGLSPTGGLLAAMGEPAEKWWPDLLRKNLETGIYPWVVKERIPSVNPNIDAPIDVELDMAAFSMTDAHLLSTWFRFLERDPAWFGPKYVMPVFLQASSRGKAKLMAFSKTPGSANYTWIGTGDTVNISGDLLQKPDSILVVIARTSGVSPFAGHSTESFSIDLRPAEGDVWLTGFRDLADNTHFTCDRQGESVTMDQQDNAESIWQLLAGFGSWKPVTGPTGTSLQWTPTPEYADTLRKYGMTMTGTMTFPAGAAIRLQSRFAFDWTTSSTPSAPPQDAGAGWLWLLLPLGALPFLFRGRARVRAVVAAAVGAVVVVGCEIGQIEMAMDESFDYQFTDFTFTLDPADSSKVFLELRDGSGKTTLTSYKSAYWEYIKDNTGTVTDSVKVSCTGNGNATYTVDMEEWKDGVTPPSAPPMDALLGRALRVSPEVVKARIRAPQ